MELLHRSKAKGNLYRIGSTGAGNVNRIVVNKNTGEIYYSWTHYGDLGDPAFVKIR